jgi:catechol 2,3-dioxygenase-like lactoylglutathione lyase family enzyme
MPEFPAVTHVALTVSSLERSVPWYGALFDSKPVLDEDTGPFHHVVWLLGNTLVGIHQFPDLVTDEAFSVVTQGRGTPLDGGRTGGAIVETVARDVLARFTNPPGGGPDYHGVLVCRWTGGHGPDASDAALVGVLTEHAVALVHRERTTGAVHPRDVAPHIASALTAAQRVAAASGILTALHQLTPAQARQLLHRASEHTHRPVLDIADMVLHTGALPGNHRPSTR